MYPTYLPDAYTLFDVRWWGVHDSVIAMLKLIMLSNAFLLRRSKQSDRSQHVM